MHSIHSLAADDEFRVSACAPGYDEELPSRLLARHQELKRLARQMHAGAERGELDEIGSLLLRFWKVRSGQVEDRNAHLLWSVQESLQDDPERGRHLKDACRALAYHTSRTGEIVSRYLAQGVCQRNLDAFRRDLHQLRLAIFFHDAYASCVFLPLYDELGWKSGTLTLPPWQPPGNTQSWRVTEAGAAEASRPIDRTRGSTPDRAEVQRDALVLSRLISCQKRLRRTVVAMKHAATYHRLRPLLVGFRDTWFEKVVEHDMGLSNTGPFFRRLSATEFSRLRSLRIPLGSACLLIDRFLDDYLHRPVGWARLGGFENALRQVEITLSDYFDRTRDVYPRLGPVRVDFD